MTVSIVKYNGSLDSVRKAIDLCGGFEKLKPADKVLIKPNNCFRHAITPPYGMVTTSTMLDMIVRLLKEHGCTDISIGEGAIIGIFDELDPYTKHGFKGTGIDRVARKHGVRLIDFNEHPSQEVDLGGLKARVASPALETDFLINVPTLKTHFQTMVSLGFKNLKGCLSKDSKKKFHRSNRLDISIAYLNETIRTDLAIVDGIYMLERGPEALAGVAHRKDLIIASPDVFECDVVGSTVLGIDPSQVEYLRQFAERHGRSFDIGAIDIRGEEIESVKENLEWRFHPQEELLMPAGVTGLSAPPPGQTLCSACGATLALTLSMLAKDNPGVDFGGAAFYYGLELEAQENDARTVLYGDCAIGVNRGLGKATRIKGCPPSLTTTMLATTKALLSRPRRMRMLAIRLLKMIGIRLGLYHELFPRWDRYRSAEFDAKDFSFK